METTLELTLFYVNHVVPMLNRSFQVIFTLEKEGGLYQNKVNLSLTFPQKQDAVGAYI